MARWIVDDISPSCRFYFLKDENNETLAIIQFSKNKVFKYNVDFAYNAVENNLEKSKSFLKLKDAKKYVNEVLGI